MSRNKLTLKTGSARAKTVGKATNASTSRTIRVRTMSLRDIQESFKPNPASLEEILSSKSSNDADRKRSQTLRSGITRSYRVEKPRDSRTSLYTGALRVPRNNNLKKENRRTMGGNTVVMRSTSNKKNEIRKSLAATSLAIRDTMLETTQMIKPIQRIPSSMTRRMTTSIMNKESGVPTIEMQQLKKVTKVSNENHLPTVEQFRLYEELEELEKQLELEISEDLADI
ncbi:2292_t:CDS:2 [Diversispora eburnea]|uniref:2292_t:CDS:1 n=1 Tax=Diversispora eburnea TaxID=1213867 RepID=A0A9N8ZMP9_9GLOM|nr:2292_t:CDS:2 [Diversispora eburnea]